MSLRYKIPCFPILFFILATVSCKHKRSASHSFYYWRGSYDLDSADMQRVKALNVDHFYIHYFDVDWSEGLRSPVPKAELTLDYYSLLNEFSYTPVIFITNRTFEHISDNECDSLAQKVSRKMNKITETIEAKFFDQYISGLPFDKRYKNQDSIKTAVKKNRENIISEIQIDCDWTSGTREKYFYFLKLIKSLYPNKEISATIRLYPYKYYKKMGVPPVDKGMLMCYNLGNIYDVQTKNSIFDVAELKKYLTTESYPLQLDIAFPVFGWGVWFRNNKLMGIVHETPTFNKDSTSRTLYCFPSDTVIGSNYYREGDILRLEYPDEVKLSEAIDLVTAQVPNYNRITFYYWDTSSIKRYENVIQKAFNTY